MNQQINLYQPMFRREKKVFSALAMFQVTLIVLVGLLGIYGFAYWQSMNVESDLLRLETERDSLKQKVSELAVQFPPKKKSKALEQAIAALKIQIEEHRQVAVALAGGEVGVTKGFGDYFEALARRHVAGTWLRRVTIKGGGNQIGITGSALEPELVTSYIQNLAAEAVFAGATFNVLNLTVSETELDEQVNFVLRTTGQGDIDR